AQPYQIPETGTFEGQFLSSFHQDVFQYLCTGIVPAGKGRIPLLRHHIQVFVGVRIVSLIVISFGRDEADIGKTVNFGVIIIAATGRVGILVIQVDIARLTTAIAGRGARVESLPDVRGGIQVVEGIDTQDIAITTTDLEVDKAELVETVI